MNHGNHSTLAVTPPPSIGSPFSGIPSYVPPQPASAELRRKLADVERQMRPLIALGDALRLQIREVESREFIAANGITADQVEMPDGPDKGWFGTAFAFGTWMRTHGCTKRWCAWNGRIYHASDLMADKLIETPGELAHLTEAPVTRGGREF